MMEKLSPAIAQLGRASLFCKTLYATLALGFAISQSNKLFHFFTITARNLIPGPDFQPWTVFTYFIVERNLIVLLMDAAVVHLCGSVLEPLWKPLDLVKFLCLVNAGVAVVSTVALLTLYTLFKDTELIFTITIHGLSGFVGAMLVAVKQIVPDSTLLATPLGRLRNTHLPGLVFLGTTVLVLCRLLKPIVLFMYLTGTYLGWIYLRFYQYHENGSRGDFTDHFSFASLFPTVLQPGVETLSGAVYRVLVRVHLCKPQIRHINLDQLTSVAVSLPGVHPNDADRRRRKALRELTERLNRTKEESSATWPALEEDEDSAPKESPTPAEQPESAEDPKLVLYTSGSEAEQ